MLVPLISSLSGLFRRTESDVFDLPPPQDEWLRCQRQGAPGERRGATAAALEGD